MSTFEVEAKIKVPVTHLKAFMDVRYWEDAEVDGVDESDEEPLIPFYSPNGWQIFVDLETGKIDGWPKGVTAKTHYKVADAGIYSLLNAAGEVVVERDWYVPSMLYPNADGFGDYVILNINEDGIIKDWKVDLTLFEGEDDD